MTTAESAQVISPKSRFDRLADRAQRLTQAKARAAGVRSRATREEADAYKARMAALTEAHKVEFERVDWDDIVETGPVAADPSLRDAEANAARRALVDYRPSLFDSLLGREKEKRRQLQAYIGEAAKLDAEQFALAKAYAERHNRLLKLAPDVRAGKLAAIAGALKACGVVEALEHVVEGLSLTLEGPGRLVAIVDLPEFDSLPEEKCVMGAAGVSYNDVSMADRCQLQLTSAASITLRVAVEVLQVAPMESVEIVGRLCSPKDPDGETFETVLHVKVPAAVFKKAKLSELDPAPTLTAMGARLDWSDARGLAEIQGDVPTQPARAA